MDWAWETGVLAVVEISFTSANGLLVTESLFSIVPTSLGTGGTSHVEVFSVGFIIDTVTAESRALRTRVVRVVVIRTSRTDSLLITSSAERVSPAGFLAG